MFQGPPRDLCWRSRLLSRSEAQEAVRIIFDFLILFDNKGIICKGLYIYTQLPFFLLTFSVFNVPIELDVFGDCV